jgi:hypothetical protein
VLVAGGCRSSLARPRARRIHAYALGAQEGGVFRGQLVYVLPELVDTWRDGSLQCDPGCRHGRNISGNGYYWGLCVCASVYGAAVRQPRRWTTWPVFCYAESPSALRNRYRRRWAVVDGLLLAALCDCVSIGLQGITGVISSCRACLFLLSIFVFRESGRGRYLALRRDGIRCRVASAAHGRCSR